MLISLLPVFTRYITEENSNFKKFVYEFVLQGVLRIRFKNKCILLDTENTYENDAYTIMCGQMVRFYGCYCSGNAILINASFTPKTSRTHGLNSGFCRLVLFTLLRNSLPLCAIGSLCAPWFDCFDSLYPKLDKLERKKSHISIAKIWEITLMLINRAEIGRN